MLIFMLVKDMPMFLLNCFLLPNPSKIVWMTLCCHILYIGKWHVCHIIAPITVNFPSMYFIEPTKLFNFQHQNNVVMHTLFPQATTSVDHTNFKWALSYACSLNLDHFITIPFFFCRWTCSLARRILQNTAILFSFLKCWNLSCS